MAFVAFFLAASVALDEDRLRRPIKAWDHPRPKRQVEPRPDDDPILEDAFDTKHAYDPCYRLPSIRAQPITGSEEGMPSLDCKWRRICKSCSRHSFVAPYRFFPAHVCVPYDENDFAYESVADVLEEGMLEEVERPRGFAEMECKFEEACYPREGRRKLECRNAYLCAEKDQDFGSKQ